MSNISIKNQCLSIIDSLLQCKDILDLPNANSELQYLKSRLTDDEFRIAVVGEYSSGKSTFINALLGKDILTHATTETTAAITRLVNVPKDDPRCYTGEVFLSSGDKIHLENFNALREYTTKGSHDYDVINDISAVELYLPLFQSPRRIVLIDTPGLNGIAEGHYERTVELIQQAHACIYLLQLRGLSESDVRFIRDLQHYQKNFIFVQNFIDEIRTAEGEDLDIKLDEQKKILSEQVFEPDSNVHYSICGVSALMALTSRDESIPSLYNGSPLLTQEARRELYSSSNFEQFNSILEETFSPEKLERIQHEGTAQALMEWMTKSLNRIEYKERNVRDAYESSKDSKSMERMQALRQKVLDGKERQKEYLRNYITSDCDRIRKDLDSKLKGDLEEVNTQISERIHKNQDIESLEAWSQELSFELEQKINIPIRIHSNRCVLELHSLYQRILDRIVEYSGINSSDFSPQPINLVPPKKTEQHFIIEDRIKNLNQKQQSEEKKVEGLESEIIQKQAAQAKAAEETARISRQKTNAVSECSAQLARLGPQPAVQERQERRTEYVYRGGLGILDWFLGPKEVIRYRTVQDDTELRAWQAKKAEINNAHAKKIAELELKLKAANRAVENSKREVGEASSKCERAKENVKKIEEEIRLEQKVLQQQKDKASSEFLAKYKNDLCQQVKAYLLGSDSVYTQASEHLRNNIDDNEKIFIQQAHEMFDNAIKQKLEMIDQVMAEKYPVLLIRAERLGEAGNLLNEMHQTLEEIL